MHSLITKLSFRSQFLKSPFKTPCISPFKKPSSQIRNYAKDSKGDRLSQMRNIGISAHIDSGKTTLTERILYYTGRIDQIHEVRGKDGVGAKMDSMDLEREKGITIKSAATHVNWKNNVINIIDTPGHVDFTIEVERSLHVLDGAILVICGVNGVQSQTMTVDRQMKRYKVPRLIFINKLDRLGADPWKVIKALKSKLRVHCAAIQIPIGVQHGHNGVVDIISRTAITFEGDKGENVELGEVPERYKQIMEDKRKILLETISDIDDGIAEKLLEGKDPSVKEIKEAIRKAVLDRTFVPVLMGSAFKNKGVQTLLDAVIDYLPAPNEREVVAYTKSDEGSKVILEADSKKPLVAYAFKLEESKFGQITWLRVYQGLIKKGMNIYNVNVDQKLKVPKLAHMHAGELEDIPEARAGDICAMFGVDCASGETFTDGSLMLTMQTMHVPDPVISLAVDVKSKQQVHVFAKALKRFQREDPTFRVTKDMETQETLIEGMGELHLEIYLERMKREYELQVSVGKPRVAFRETITTDGPFEYTHKKQSGGAGQYAKVIGRLEPVGEDEVIQTENGETEPLLKEFVNSVIGNNIPPGFITAVKKGYEDCMEKGPLIGHPIERVRMILLDGAHHAVDSSEYAFRVCTHFAFKQGFMAADPGLLEPIMNVEIICPMEFQSQVLSLLNKRRGTIVNSTIDTAMVTIEAEVPLVFMFGYATDLRSVTEGKGEFTMEYKCHALVSRDRLPGIIEQYRQKAEADAKKDR